MSKELSAYLLLTSILTGCYIPNEQPKVEVYTERDTLTVIGKRIEHVNSNFWSKGYDKYMIALSNGDGESCSYGEYTCLEVGDTIFRHRLNTEFWWKWDYDCK